MGIPTIRCRSLALGGLLLVGCGRLEDEVMQPVESPVQGVLEVPELGSWAVSTGAWQEVADPSCTRADRVRARLVDLTDRDDEQGSLWFPVSEDGVVGPEHGPVVLGHLRGGDLVADALTVEVRTAELLLLSFDGLQLCPYNDQGPCVDHGSGELRLRGEREVLSSASIGPWEDFLHPVSDQPLCFVF